MLYKSDAGGAGSALFTFSESLATATSQNSLDFSFMTESPFCSRLLKEDREGMKKPSKSGKLIIVDLTNIQYTKLNGDSPKEKLMLFFGLTFTFCIYLGISTYVS